MIIEVHSDVIILRFSRPRMTDLPVLFLSAKNDRPTSFIFVGQE